MSAGRFSRPPESGNVEELRVYAWAYDVGYDTAAQIAAPAITSLRDQLAARDAEIARRDAADTAEARWWSEYVNAASRGDTRSHLEVLTARAEAHPESYAEEIARAQAHHDRVWAPLVASPSREETGA